ncbi:hypothetical protein JRO89_XS02G0056300 [Xanthoceras sorbifolium]|uniref:TF-B3 domain-containing protein n=1 Tax=Xanthoceras sorbifolium TaxID=99658 RepID=A0ABQ8IES3_9ROSI|nr:hypothetical protein JRO89_XS02G0056300 [Xanthoceras sorbifolium]
MVIGASTKRASEQKQELPEMLSISPSYRTYQIMIGFEKFDVLRIPEKFVRKFGDELSAFVTLTVPNGLVWRVRLTKDEKKIWFDDGWNDFVQYHSVSIGHFLVFKYKKNSNFNALIFDTSCCEIQYPCNGEEPKNEENSDHHDENENKDSREITIHNGEDKHPT